MIENPKNANISNKVKTNSGCHRSAVCVWLHLLACSSVWFELGNVGTKVCQSSPTQRSGFQFSYFDSGWRSAAVVAGPGGGGQMRVSWCQRLDGRMLSTFSMMKFRGANSVLRNCKERGRYQGQKTVGTVTHVAVLWTAGHSLSVSSVVVYPALVSLLSVYIVINGKAYAKLMLIDHIYSSKLVVDLLNCPCGCLKLTTAIGKHIYC